MLVDAKESAGDARNRSLPSFRILGVTNPDGDATDIAAFVLAVATDPAEAEPAEVDEPTESELLIVVGLGGAPGGAGVSQRCLGVCVRCRPTGTP